MKNSPIQWPKRRRTYNRFSSVAWLFLLLLTVVCVGGVYNVNQPLSDEEIENMTRDAPHLFRAISDTHMVTTNASFASKSAMDTMCPFVLGLVDRIDRVQMKLGGYNEIRLNTSDVRTRLNRDWKECNSTFETARQAVGVKLALEKLATMNMKTFLKEMNLQEQVDMRKKFTHARLQVMAIPTREYIDKVMKATDASISRIYDTASKLMTVLQELRFVMARRHSQIRAKERFAVLWKEAEDEHHRKMHSSWLGEYRA